MKIGLIDCDHTGYPNISITNLEAVRQRLAAKPELQAELQAEPGTHPLDRICIVLTRTCAEWLLADINKHRSRLAQSVHDPKTRQPKREKKCRELCIVEDIILFLQNSISNHDTEDNQH